MTASTNNTSASTTNKPRAAYLVQQDARKRFTFGKVWEQAVVDGHVSDKAKLVAHALKLKVGRKSDLSKLKFDTLLAKVQAGIAKATKPTTH